MPSMIEPVRLSYPNLRGVELAAGWSQKATRLHGTGKELLPALGNTVQLCRLTSMNTVSARLKPHENAARHADTGASTAAAPGQTPQHSESSLSRHWGKQHNPQFWEKVAFARS